MTERPQRSELLRHRVLVLPHTDATSQVSRERLATVARQLQRFNATEVLRSTFQRLTESGQKCALVPEHFHQEPSVPSPIDGEEGLFYRHPDGTVRSGIGWDFQQEGKHQVAYDGIRILAHPGFILVQGADTAVIDPRVMQEYRTIAGQTSPEMNPFVAAVNYSIAHPGRFTVSRLTMSDAASSLVPANGLPAVDFGD